MTDLKSHHGTYILRPGDSVSRPIAAEVPSVLADGDVLTFGKPVGKDKDMVKPIVARVKLQFSRDAQSQPVSVQAISATASRESHLQRNVSGRYGIFQPPSDISSSSESDSEIEEIPPPYTLPTLQTHGYEISPRGTNILRAASVIVGHHPSIIRRQLLPSLSIFMTPSPEPFAIADAESLSDVRDMEIESSPEVEVKPLPVAVPLSPPAESPEMELPAVPEIIGAWPDAPENVEDASPSAASTPPPLEDDAITHVSFAGHLLTEEHILEAQELAHDDFYVEVDEPLSYNVWARTSPESEPHPEESPRVSPQVEAPVEELVEKPMEVPMTFIVCFLLLVAASLSNDDIYQESETSSASKQVKEPVALDAVAKDTHLSKAVTTSELQSDNASALNTLREGAPYTVPHHYRMSSPFVFTAMEEMRNQAQKEIEKELEALRAARAEAEAAAKQLQLERNRIAQERLEEYSSVNSRKRKFSDDDDADISTTQVGIPIPAAVASPLKRRRTMGFISAVAQTTAVATLGAVAAWTALAYT